MKAACISREKRASWGNASAFLPNVREKKKEVLKVVLGNST